MTGLRWWPALLFPAVSCLAQQKISLSQAIDAAAKKYPAVRVSEEQMRAASAGVTLARTAWLPRADFITQLNRATRNNVFGLVLPQAVLPGISGPPNPANDLTSVWGSAVGFLVSWEPFDFGLRKANLEAAQTAQKRTEAAIERTHQQVAFMAAEAFLTLVAAEQTRKAAEAQVQRARTVLEVVSSLVRAELRPGVDEARAKAEVALAQMQVIQADQAVRTAQAVLEELTGLQGTPVAEGLLERPPQADKTAKLEENPAAREQRAAVEEAQARVRALEKSWYPRFNAQAASYARGTGARPDGGVGGAWAGLGPNIYNWAVGMTVTFPALEEPALRARREAEVHRTQAEEARYQQILSDLRMQHERAQAAEEAARRVAEQMPAQLEAARAAEQQALARYKAGLATLVDVADTQRLLTQTEIDSALARLNIWRALLQVAYVRGNIEQFRKQVQP